MSHFLSSKSALAPDLPLFEGTPVISVMSVSQMPPLRYKAAVLQLPGAPSVILAQTLFPQRTVLAVPLIRLLEPVQLAGAAVQGIQPQLFSFRANIGVLFSVIGKGIPLQLYVGTVMGGLGPDKERDSFGYVPAAPGT